jgi:glucosyl-dolichyl phosphate glucuronosyltransferase
MDSLPLISTVICTHNRADYLEKAIRSVLGQRMSPAEYELIVVDNNSTDATAEFVGRFSHFGNLRYIFEPALGLCNARNTGWRKARGQYVAYLDDDAIAEPGWLSAIKEAFESNPSLGVVGGPAVPIWEVDRPGWLSDDVAVSLAILHWSENPKRIADVRREWLVGANMAVPAAVLFEVGGFHPWLDRVGAQMLSSGDVFLQKKIIERGYVCLYYPAMAIRHHIHQSRLQKEWFARRYYAQGLSDFVMQLIETRPSLKKRFWMALTMVAELILSPRKLSALLLPSNNPKRLTEKYFALIKVGHIAGLMGALRK